jgi:hypothetical protein
MATLVGDFGNNTLVGIKGEDNLIYGDTSGQQSGQMSIGGNDTLIGGTNSNNTLIGDADSMASPVTGGNDTLIGGKGGTNTLIGDAVTSIGAAPTGGDDRLVSAANTTDHMWGDFQSVNGGPPIFGHDTFVFGPRNGNDYIYDFHQGEDIIEIDIPTKGAGQFPTTFADLNIEQVDANADSITDSVIDFGGNNSVTVYGVTGLVDTDFQFFVV